MPRARGGARARATARAAVKARAKVRARAPARGRTAVRARAPAKARAPARGTRRSPDVKRRFRTPYGRFAVVRAALLVFLLTAIVVVGVAFMLDRNAQHSNSQQSAAELASGSRVAASVFATLRANLRAHAGNLASSLPLQRAVVTSNRSELRRLAHASNARIVVRGKPFGSLPSAPRVTATATIGDGRRVLARVEIAVKLDDQLIALLGQATPLPRYAGLILVR